MQADAAALWAENGKVAGWPWQVVKIGAWRIATAYVPGTRLFAASGAVT
jgi:hypothetical protein